MSARRHPPPRPAPPPLRRPPIPGIVVGQHVADTFGGALSASMDTLKTLLLDSGAGAARSNTRTVIFGGPHTAGTLEFFTVPWDADLVYCVSQTNHIMITNGRTLASFGQGFSSEGGVALFGQYPWKGRQSYNSGDRLSIDTSSAALPASSYCCLVFELRL